MKAVLQYGDQLTDLDESEFSQNYDRVCEKNKKEHERLRTQENASGADIEKPDDQNSAMHRHIINHLRR